MDAQRRAQLTRVLDGYFDLRTAVIVDRAQSLLTLDDLADAGAADRLFDDLVDVLVERYGRDDPGWAASARALLRAEWDRQLDATRAFYASLEEGGATP